MILLCGGCGYNLRASSGRCPHCGREFDPGHLTTALIPWEQRRHLLPLVGRLTAWVWTAAVVTFQPTRMAALLAHPVSLRDARRFRLVTVLVAGGAVLAAAVALRPWAVRRYSASSDWRDEPARLLTSPWSLGVMVAGVVLGMFAATAVTAWFFRPARLGAARRARAAAPGYYAGSAPLAWAPVVLAAEALGWTDGSDVRFFGQVEPRFVPALAECLATGPHALAGSLLVVWLGIAL